MIFEFGRRNGIDLPFATVEEIQALDDAREKLGISSRLIMCFLRHFRARAAMEALQQALSYKNIYSERTCNYCHLKIIIIDLIKIITWKEKIYYGPYM